MNINSILIEDHEVYLKNGYTFEIPWDRSQNYMNFPFPEDVWLVDKITEYSKEEIHGVIVGCDLPDYSILSGFPKCKSLYLYNATSLSDLSFVTNLIWLNQLYIGHSHISDITPILQLLETKKERWQTVEDPWERVWLPLDGIYIDTNQEIYNIDQLISAAKWAEIWINGERRKRG